MPAGRLEFTQFPGQPTYMGGGSFAGVPSSARIGSSWSPSGRLLNPQSPELASRAETTLMSPVGQGYGEAFLRSLGRDVGGPIAGLIDRPQAGVEYNPGVGGFLKRLSTNIPWIGALLKGHYSGQTADQYQGWLADDPSQEGALSRLWASIQSTGSLVPSGAFQGAGMMKNVIGGVGGLMQVPDYLNTTFGQAASRVAGGGIRELFNRGGGGSAPPSRPTPGGMGIYSEPYTPGQYAWALDPTLNPGGFPTMGGVPSTIEQSNNPFYNPDTGITPTWAR